MKGVRSDLVDLRLVVQQLNDRESLVTMKATAMLSLSQNLVIQAHKSVQRLISTYLRQPLLGCVLVVR